MGDPLNAKMGACGGKEAQEELAKKEAQIKTLETAEKDLKAKLAAAEAKVETINDQLKGMIVPRTIKDIEDLRKKKAANPQLTAGWTDADEEEMMNNKQMIAVLESSNEWIFDSFRMDDVTGGFPLPKFAYWTFKEHDLINQFNVKVPKLFNFCRIIQAKYEPNTYHNVIHGVDVAHAMHFWMRRGLLADSANSLQVMAAVVGSFCHDTGHPAKNNAFMVNSKNRHALLYNDSSVLENLHLTLLFETYNEPGCDFLDSMNRDEWMAFRKQCISMILATDFGRHNEILSIAQERLKQGPMDLQKESDFDLTMKIGIKCADLRHCMMPHEMTQRTTALLMEEFWGQGDMEKSMGLPVSPFMSREKANLPKEQAGFYQFMIMPLVSVWAEIIPTEASVALDYSKRNWETWQKKGAKKFSEAAG